MSSKEQPSQEPAVRFYEQVTLDLTQLKPDPDNPNVMDTALKNGLHTGINKFGFVQPIVVDQWDVICDGHNRVEDLLKRGIKEAPGYRVQLVDPDERRLIRQMMNQTHGQNDPDKYALELKAVLLTNGHGATPRAVTPAKARKVGARK